jgi:NTE family protein
LGGLLSACTLAPDADHTDAEAPKVVPLARRPRVAWVFSSGGPRGFAHVGVIKALEELKLQPDLLVGASVGSLVATICASGKSAAHIEQLALELSPLALGRYALGADERLSGSAIADLARREAGTDMLEHLNRPVVCVAARKSTGELMAFNAGDLGLAVQASCAIEGQFTPVRIRGQQYVDPDHYQPMPVRLARQLGALKVLAVDASAHEYKAPAGSERYRAGDQRKRALTEPDARAADIALHPDFGYWVSMSREFRQRAIQAGYQHTMDHAARIVALHQT